MEPNAFVDKDHPPQPEELVEALGESARLWQHLLGALGERFQPLEEAWGFWAAWSLRPRRKRRAILYMTPHVGSFTVSFALGEKAVAKATTSDLPAWVLEVIDSAPRYAEGRGVRLRVTSLEDVQSIVKIAEAKMST